MKAEKIIDKGFEFPFIVRTPKNMKDGLPLIVQLHGAGERGDGSNLDVVEIHGFSHVFTDEAEIDCIFVQPQCPENSFWAANVPFIKSFIEKIIAEYKCDKDRVYLTGLSMGGYGTWFTAMAFPEMFAAIAPCCGGGMPWNAGVLTMPVWAFHGGKDDVVFPYESENMVEGMRKAGLNPKYTVFPEYGHNSWEKAYSKELLEWLLAQKR